MNIRDIASAAHVSVATVSKVINHKDSEISNETRQRVLSVIKEYQYTPYANIQASFQTFHRQTIAFLTEKNSAVSKYVFDIEKNDLNYVLEAAKKIMNQLENKLHCDGFTLVQNNGIVEEVKHFHLHIKPMYQNEENLILLPVEEIYSKIKEG